ncbi:hypothetical protein BDD43_0163 [Mucilaginibacter gracilis]|uniref:Uncharacterized protein n=1 Tax=Mucilaginibacter gracilis TaxID=423350 RepID=A0A495ITS9_9SPHI|nr:hypothetical protein [Mucilaginibacter gracilis]RKR80070.1 hypothetical protein BDD43_0163 [Mucilaginibacter gracilis]
MKVLKRNRQVAAKYRQQVIGRLNESVVKRQRVLADFLDRKTQHWNIASKFLFLLGICLLLGALSLSLIIRAFY